MALILAAARNCQETPLLLLEHRADVNVQNVNGVTALMNAILFNREYLVPALIKHGALLDLQYIVGKTALMIAAQKGSNQIVEQLIEAGANINLQSTMGTK